MVGPLEASWKAVTDALAPVTSTVSSVAETAGSSVVSAARSTVLAKRDVDNQGTPLRDGIRAARESWNAAVEAADGAATSAARETDGFATLVVPAPHAAAYDDCASPLAAVPSPGTRASRPGSQTSDSRSTPILTPGDEHRRQRSQTN